MTGELCLRRSHHDLAPQSIIQTPKARIVFLSSLILGSSDIDPTTTLFLKDPNVEEGYAMDLAPQSIIQTPKARIVFLSSLILGSSDIDPRPTLFLKDPNHAAHTRDRLARQLVLVSAPQVLVLDLAGIAFTPSALQELILPLAQRIRGGEYGTVRLIISHTDEGVRDFIRYMAQTHHLPLYLSHSPFDLRESTPAGDLTTTERNTLDTVISLGGQVTASRLAAKEGIRPSAAANRLVNLDREGYLVRQPRGRREGDIYIEPRSATTTPIVFDGPYDVSQNSTVPGKPVRQFRPLQMGIAGAL